MAQFYFSERGNHFKKINLRFRPQQRTVILNLERVAGRVSEINHVWVTIFQMKVMLIEIDEERMTYKNACATSGTSRVYAREYKWFQMTEFEPLSTKTTH